MADALSDALLEMRAASAARVKLAGSFWQLLLSNSDFNREERLPQQQHALIYLTTPVCYCSRAARVLLVLTCSRHQNGGGAVHIPVLIGADDWCGRASVTACAQLCSLWVAVVCRQHAMAVEVPLLCGDDHMLRSAINMADTLPPCTAGSQITGKQGKQGQRSRRCLRTAPGGCGTAAR